MTKPNIEFCEDKIDKLGTFNVLSNLFIILGGIYGLLEINKLQFFIYKKKLLKLAEINFIIVGLGSMFFHYRKDYLSELFDEIPMVTLIIFYFFIAGINEPLYLRISFAMFSLLGILVYLIENDFKFFEKIFTLQIVYLVLLLFKNYKNYKQRNLFILGILTIIFSKSLWNYEQYLFRNDICPNNKKDICYYLHSFWHMGVSGAHVLLMHGLRM